MHPSLCTEDTVDLLAACGCKELRIGLESGNDYIRMQLLNRNLSRETIRSAFENAKVRGMNAFSFNMVGLPHENAHRVLDTIKLNAECETDDAQVSIFYPYPGTRLYDLCGDEGLLSGRRLDSYYLGSVLNLPDLTHDQVMMFQLFFNKLMKLYRPLLKLPRWLSRPLIWALDGFVSLRAVASIVMSSRKVLHASRRARGKPALRHKYTATVEAS